MSSISYRPHSLDGSDEDLHFITSYVPNSKFKPHHTGKVYHTYELQYMHCFLGAKIAFRRGVRVYKNYLTMTPEFFDELCTFRCYLYFYLHVSAPNLKLAAKNISCAFIC